MPDPTDRPEQQEVWEVRDEPGSCPTCHGTGEAEVPHPRWGQWNCPEPYTTIPCPRCFPGDW